MIYQTSYRQQEQLELPYQQYELLKGRFNLALIVFFALTTYTFGYFTPPSAGDTKNFGSLLMIGLVVVFGLIKFIDIKLVFNFKYSTMLYFILLWMLILVFFRDDLGNSFKNFANILLTQVFIIFVVNIFWSIPFDKFIYSLILFFHVLMVVCVLIHIKNGSSFQLGNHDVTVRLGGLFFFGVTGILSGFAAVISSFMFFKQQKFRKKVFYLTSFLMFTMYCLAADLRTVLAAVALSLFIQFFFKRLSARKSVIPLFFLAALLYGGIQFYQSHAENSDNVESDLGVRQAIWGVAERMIKKEPLIGYGNYYDAIRGFSMSDPHYNDYFKDLGLPDPHSSFLSLPLQSGLITFGLFLFLLFRICLNTRHYLMYDRGLLGLVVFWLICGSTGGTFFDYNYDIRGVFFEISLFGIMLHPDLFDQNTEIENEE